MREKTRMAITLATAMVLILTGLLVAVPVSAGQPDWVQGPPPTTPPPNSNAGGNGQGQGQGNDKMPNIHMNGWNPPAPDVWWEPLIWEKGDPLNVYARIWNDGEAPTHKFTVAFYAGWWGVGAPWYGTPEATTQVDNIGPKGEYVDVMLHIEATTSTRYNADIVADIAEPYPPGDVVETDEEDNYAHRCISSQGGGGGGGIIFPLPIWNPVNIVGGPIQVNLFAMEFELVGVGSEYWEPTSELTMDYTLQVAGSAQTQSIGSDGAADNFGLASFSVNGASMSAGAISAANTVSMMYPPILASITVDIPLGLEPGSVYSLAIYSPELMEYADELSPAVELIIVIE